MKAHVHGIAALAMTLAGFATPLSAATPAHNSGPFYVGIKVGAASITPDNDDAEYSRTSDDSDASTGVFAGVRLATLPVGQGWPLHLEVGYTDLGKSRVRYRLFDQYCGPYYCDTWLTTRGWSRHVALKQDFVINDFISIVGLAGASFNRVLSSTPVGYPEMDVSGKRTGVMLGVGGQFNWRNGFSLRAEVVSYGEGSRDSDAAGANLAGVFRF